ncbi:MAG: SDR family NAD(P)-dependent oxidoreductase, partial [bacterium]
ARTEPKLREFGKELEKNFKIRTHVFPGDLSLPQTPAKLFAQIQTAQLEVDVVINNAGFGKYGPFESVPGATYQEMCNLNINSVVALTHLFLPGMLKKRDGGFINVASTAAFQPVPYFTTYSATKSFVLNFSEALWAEYKNQGITITCLCPGSTESNFHDRANSDPKKLIGMESAEKVARIGLKAFLKGRPMVISGTKNFLIANSSRFVSRKMVAKITAAMFAPDN